jgi:6-phosphogluconolactonase
MRRLCEERVGGRHRAQCNDDNVDIALMVAKNAESASASAAELLAGAARRGGAIALSGGSTPRRVHELAAKATPDWSSAHVWLCDERMVPEDDPLSNARLVRETLLEHLEVAPQVHFVRTDLPPAEAAAAYDAELRGVRIRLALLGIGPDGHTASLFPEAPTLEVCDRLAVHADPGLEPWVPRVTLTIPALAAVERVVFVATGSDKAGAVRRAFAEPPSPATPASLVRSAHGTTTAILDREAASLLDQ